ncbi:MAG: energy-coupling factor transporter transmembrane protein EcfT [Cyanobacteria bacterium P01_E01_bin.34]
MVDLLRNVPLGTYLEFPQTWLHRLDPRVKFVWLITILVNPILANSWWRLAIVAFTILLTWTAPLPWRVWRRQLLVVAALAVFAVGLTAFAPGALGVSSVPVRPGADMGFGFPVLIESEPLPGEASPSSEILDLENPEQPIAANDSGSDQFSEWTSLQTPTGYRYQLFETPSILGRKFQVTRRSLSVAVRLGTLIFTLLYSTALFLLTTSPEEISEAIAFFASPLRWLNVPVTEVVLALTLSLRFLPLVLEEVQNILRAVNTRDIHWQSLGFKGAAQLGLSMVERILQNLLLRAEQTASAMQVRGYIGAEHAVRWHVLKMSWLDWLVLVGVPLFWASRFAFF